MATKNAIKGLGVRRTGSGIPKPTMEQTREIRALQDNWHREKMKFNIVATVTHHQTCNRCDQVVSAGSIKMVWIKFFLHLKLKHREIKDLPFWRTLIKLVLWKPGKRYGNTNYKSVEPGVYKEDDDNEMG